MLAAAELLTYLLERDHLGPEAVLDGGLTFVDTSRRNHNVRVSAESVDGLFIKQGRSDGGGSLEHEAAVYALLDSLPAGRPGGVSSVLTRCHGYDPDRHLLVLKLLDNAPNLVSYHAFSRRFPVTMAGRLGTALADLHDRATEPARLRPNHFPGHAPWAIGIDRPGLAFYREMSFGAVELVQMLQSSPALRAALAELRADWRADAFVHHDLKWDNCVALAPGKGRRRTRLAVVDWEFADLGDAAWDLGSVFAAYLECWRTSIPVTGSEQPDQYLGLAEFPLVRMQPAIQAFWSGYAAAAGWDHATADAALVRSTRYAGARLLQSAYERVQGSPRVTADVVCLAQLADNVLVRPEEAIEHLLAIGTAAAPVEKETHE